MTSDQELLRKWASRADEAAFRALVERHAGLVHGVAARRAGGNDALAREIGQTVFAVLARKAGSLAGHPCPVAWLHRATLLEAARQVRREAAHERRVAAFAKAQADAARAASGEGEAPAVPLGFDEALEGLRERDREVLLRRFFEGLSYREIALATGQKEAALRKRAERALECLACRLSRGSAAVSSLAAAGTARAALTHTAPAGFAESAVASAVAPAPALTAASLTLHTLRCMTFGKTIPATGALALLLLTFYGGHAAAVLSRGGSSSDSLPASADPPKSAVPPDGGPAGGLIATSSGNPGDSPQRARLRSILRRISKGIRVNLVTRGVVFGLDDPAMPGGADGFRAMAELGDDEVDEAWNLLPDFRGNPGEYEGLAAFLASMRLAKEPPREVLERLLKDECRVNGRPATYAVYETVKAWFRQDPAATWNWMRHAVGTGDYPFDRRRPWGEDSVGIWLKKDPAAALAALTPLPPEWSNFQRKALGTALGESARNNDLWSAIQSADDDTALMVAGSQPARNEWSRGTLLPWLMTRQWADGKTTDRVTHEWMWRDGALDHDRFAMLCESLGTLPTPEANAAALKAVKGILGDARSESGARLLDYLVPEPASREKIQRQLSAAD